MNAAGQNRRLGELAVAFLKLGSIGFGGPAAHIALMEAEFVRRRRWLSSEEFLDLLGATNLIPGPNSTEMAIHIGLRRAGWAGWLVAGVSFIGPAMMLVMAIAWAYQRYGSLPEVAGVLYGLKPIIIAIVLQSLWNLARTAIKTKVLALLTVAGILLNVAGVNEVAILFGAGVLFAAMRAGAKNCDANSARCIVPLAVASSTGPLAVAGAASVAAAAASPFSLGSLFLLFVKIGSVLFGSGYVLLAFLRAELVERAGWLSESQLLDAVAVGQMVPGPVFTTATFIGYLLGGPLAAGVATAGIFLPAFFFVAISGPLVPRLRESAVAGAFLDAVICASLALMVVVTWQLGAAALVDATTVALAGIAAVLLLRYRINSAWLVLGGAVAGGLSAVW